VNPAVEAIIDRIREAHGSGRPLCIRGGGTKDFYGEAPSGDVLDVGTLVGAVDHEPTELVVTAPAGLPLADLEALLDAQGQSLAFEPPRFAPGSTVGGMVAAGLSGPSRAAAGSVRDHVLGVTMVSGTGELMHFGGRVIKNVAGYDVSRLVAGSLGILGVIVEVSLKVLPKAAAEATLRFDLDAAPALALLHAWGAKPLPLDASAWWNGNLVVRLRGSPAAVDEATRALGGEPVADAMAVPFWQGLRDQGDPFFTAANAAVARGDATLWRLSLPQTAPVLANLGLAGEELIEWHGAERWLLTPLPAATVRAAAARAHGHATAFRSPDKAAGAFSALAKPLAQIHERLKRSFDPKGILNPGRLYPGL
jgi:glycolate dehydrogenase FAD-binding subunit